MVLTVDNTQHKYTIGEDDVKFTVTKLCKNNIKCTIGNTLQKGWSWSSKLPAVATFPSHLRMCMRLECAL